MAPLTLPRDRGGWWHQYVCPVHGTELAHDGLLSGTFPEGGAACAHGCRLDTPEIRGAWTVLAHQACALRLRELAASSADEDRAAAAAGLEAYAKLYAELTAEGELHAGAQGWMLRGRIFHQALTEAIWAVNIAHAARSLGAEAPPAAEPMLAGLAAAAEQARDKLIADGKESSNYTAWLNAAATTCITAARRRKEGPEWSDAAEKTQHRAPADHHVFSVVSRNSGPGPLRGHPAIATHPDGWEWEGSTYYHLFVLRAYLLSLRGTDPAALSPDDADRLAAMIAVLQGIATPSGELPELHDGPYRRQAALAELREVCLLAHQLYEGEPLAKVLAWAAARTPEPPADLRDWFRGEPLSWPYETIRRTFPDAGYTVIRAAGIHAVLDAGPHGGSHGHQDKLALYLYGDGAAWQPDPGQVPYGHRHFREYYASAAAHPTFTVDGDDQLKVDALPAGQGGGSCQGAYDGVHATRTLIPADSYLLDVLTIESADERTLTAHLRPAVRFEAVTGPDGTVSTVWGEGEGPVLSGLHRSSATSAEFTLHPHPGPADDPSRPCQGADWSVHGRRAVFVSAYHRGRSHLRDLRLSDDTATVVLTDGSTHDHRIGD
ncbi:heparinase II/III domain-containing protein [Streptomyces boninensis]|uniref:heparinase II/III domain-containing protein n=1 Tax=Streptomyces boninensis TaxID=2039455 RepID=UPI003B21613F